MTGEPGTGCPPGSTVCDQLVTGGWPDAVIVVTLLVCAAAVLIAWIRR